jgi:hypothetical protein
LRRIRVDPVSADVPQVVVTGIGHEVILHLADIRGQQRSRTAAHR